MFLIAKMLAKASALPWTRKQINAKCPWANRLLKKATKRLAIQTNRISNSKIQIKMKTCFIRKKSQPKAFSDGRTAWRQPQSNPILWIKTSRPTFPTREVAPRLQLPLIITKDAILMRRLYNKNRFRWTRLPSWATRSSMWSWTCCIPRRSRSGSATQPPTIWLMITTSTSCPRRTLSRWSSRTFRRAGLHSSVRKTKTSMGPPRAAPSRSHS